MTFLARNILCLCALVKVCARVSTDDMNVLHEIYNATDGVNWDYSIAFTSEWDFDSGSDPCVNRWQGVYCDDSKSVIKGLSLVGLDMKGTLPDAIGKLASMDILVVEFSSELSGSIPEGLALLENTTSLHLTDLNMSGTLPSGICGMRALQVLDISYMPSITGPLPSCLSSLSYLRKLYLRALNVSGPLLAPLPQALEEIDVISNQFTGPLPSLPTTLQRFVVSNNHIVGTFPSPLDFVAASALGQLALDYNSLTGTVPSALFTWYPSLSMLRLDSNYFYGVIPSSMGCLTNLIGFSCTKNSLSGPLPSQLSRLSRLSMMLLSQNFFSGPISSDIGTLPNMNIIYLDHNRFTGYMPDFFARDLLEIHLQANFLSGPIPTSLGSSPSLRALDISENYLDGHIVPGIFTSVAMQDISLASNFLSGTVPNVFAANNSLISLDISENFLSGSMPSSLGVLTDRTLLGPNDILEDKYGLNVLITHHNDLTGTISPELAKLRSLTTVLIHNNRLTGKLSNLFARSSNVSHALTVLDFSKNEFTGTLPAELFSDAPALEAVVGTDNCLSGSLPDSLCSASALISLILNGLNSNKRCQRKFSFASILRKDLMKGPVPSCLFDPQTMPLLRTLHLSGNGFSGTLPHRFLHTGSTIVELELSHNRLTGTLPPRTVSHGTFDLLDLSYNRLCGSWKDDEVYAQDGLYLHVNRFSGMLPPHLNRAISKIDDIRVMDGNMFDCDENHPKPDQDPQSDEEQCASGHLNDALFFTAGILIGSTAFLLVFLWSWWTLISPTPPLPRQEDVTRTTTTPFSDPSKSCAAVSEPASSCIPVEKSLDSLSNTRSVTTSFAMVNIRLLVDMLHSFVGNVLLWIDIDFVLRSESQFDSYFQVRDETSVGPPQPALSSSINTEGERQTGVARRSLIQTLFPHIVDEGTAENTSSPLHTSESPLGGPDVDACTPSIEMKTFSAQLSAPEGRMNCERSSSIRSSSIHRSSSVHRAGSLFSEYSRRCSVTSESLHGHVARSHSVVSDSGREGSVLNDFAGDNSVGTAYRTRLHSGSSFALLPSYLRNQTGGVDTLRGSDMARCTGITAPISEISASDSYDVSRPPSYFEPPPTETSSQNLAVHPPEGIAAPCASPQSECGSIDRIGSSCTTRFPSESKPNGLVEDEALCSAQFSNVRMFLRVLHEVGRLAVLLCGIIVGVATPLYTLLKLMGPETERGWSLYSTHENQYSWLISAAFLRGSTAAYLFTFMLIAIVGVFAFRIFVIHNSMRRIHLRCPRTSPPHSTATYDPGKLERESQRVGVSWVAKLSASLGAVLIEYADGSDSDEDRTDEDDSYSVTGAIPARKRGNGLGSVESSVPEHTSSPSNAVAADVEGGYRTGGTQNLSIAETAAMKAEVSRVEEFRLKQSIIGYVLIIAAVLFNSITVIVVNSFYVAVMEEANSNVQLLWEVVMAAFRICWSKLAVPKILHVVDSLAHYSSSQKTWLLLIMTIFNSVVAPCVATIVTDRQCLYDSFFGTNDVQSTYAVNYCDRVSIITLKCQREGLLNVQSSYTPPAIYNYQCSSAILHNFVPVMFYTYSVVILMSPLMYMMATQISPWWLHSWLRTKIPWVIWPLEYGEHCRHLFKPELVLAVLHSNIATMLTFGLCYPPLGVVVAIAIVSKVCFWRLMVVRYVEVQTRLCVHWQGSTGVAMGSADRGSVGSFPVHTRGFESGSGADMTVNVRDVPPHDQTGRSRLTRMEECFRNRRLIERSCFQVWRVPRSCLFVVMSITLIFGCIITMDIAGDAVGFENALKFSAVLLAAGLIGRWSIVGVKYRNYLIGEGNGGETGCAK